jgi:hypothetical protein
MAAPLDRGPSPEHTAERSARLYQIVIDIDRIELRLEEIEENRVRRFILIPRRSSKIYRYRCPACDGIVEVCNLLKPRHLHICIHCHQIVELKIILRHLHPLQESVQVGNR